ncbi:MAG TPA: hypothetical protein VJU84_00740 [Pyrinomonadaceae bacterium]|nr:hypothetical protein [Pyrinomonadaceae bacterium]
MRTKKRTLLTTKVYGFNPWMDQVTAINELMDSLGQKSEAPIIRDLIDEALAARRRRSTALETKAATPPDPDLGSKLDTTQAVLLKLIAQGGVTFDMLSVTLELVQEALLEARIGRIMLWETLAAPALRERGKSPVEIDELVETYVEDGKDYSYGLAEEIKAEMDAEDAKSSKQESAQPMPDDEDNATLDLNDSDLEPILS